MRSNSGKGKSNNNLRDPTMKEHEATRRKPGHTPSEERQQGAEDARLEEPSQAGPVR
jgi:hypothetical protein